MSAMRRTLAIALAVGLLFVGGCDRQRRAPAADQPAGTVPAAVSPAAPATATPGTDTGTDVDTLINQVDQQLSGDAQPADDED